MLAKLSVQLLWGSRVAEGRGESLVFPFFRFCGNHVYFQLFVNARHCDQQRALLEQWHQFDKQGRSSFALSLICCLEHGNLVAQSAGTGTRSGDGVSGIDE